MRVPLMANAYGDNLILTVNKKALRKPLPFKPYLIAEKPNQHLKSIDIKAIRIPDNEEVTMFKMDADTVQLNDEKAKQLLMEGKSFAKLPYLEQLYVDMPDYCLSFPNTETLDVLYLDIEVLTKGDGIFPRAQDRPIIAIGCKHNNNPVQIFDSYTRGNDSQLLSDFLDYYGRIDPDVVVTYNGHSFDMPYIIQRMLKYDMDLNQLGRYGKFRYKEGQDNIEFNGRVHLDCLIPARKDQSMCYDDRTEILTENGWKLFKDVTQSEYVATLNKDTNTLEYQKPSQLLSFDYNDNMYSIKSKSVDLLVTNNHDLLIQYPKDKRLKKEGIWEFKKPNEIFNKCYKVKRNVENWLGTEETEFILPNIERKKAEFNSLLNKSFKMKDWLEFLGYFLSKGSLYHDKKLDLYNINISQSIKHLKYVKKIRDCIHRMGFKTNYYDNNINFKSKQLFVYLKTFGESPNKFIPKFLLKLNKKLLRILFDALILSDGTKKRIQNDYETTLLYSTIFKQLADDVQEIIIKLGYASSIHEKRLHTGNVIYRVTVIKKQLTPTINVKKYNDSWIKYNGKVYCCSVPNQIILVRRNGYPVWCGNSGIKSKGLKSVSAWYGFKALSLGDEVENTQRLIGTQQLREYLISDVEATKVVSDVYLPNAIALAELIQVPLGSIVGCFPSFIPKIICARHCKRLNLVPLDNNKERYGNTKEDDNGKPTGEIEPGRLYTLGSRFQGAIVEARKFGYINNLTKVDFACVDSETELMTDEGWIKANKIKGTEKLLTFNGPSNQLTFQNMDSWNSYDYDGDMIGIQNRYIDQLVTPNHRVCYRDARKENTKWQFKEADKVPTYIKIPVSAFTISHNQIDSAKLKYLSLLPWIITEGNITTNSITISQRYTVNKDNCNMLDIICKELIKEDDLYIRNRKNRPDREYSIRGDSYEHLLFLLNNNPRRIPPWIYHTNFVFRRQFIADLIKGDGHQYTENNPGVYVSKEEDLIDDIQLLCHISGLKALKSEEYTDQRNGCKWFYLHITAESEAHVGLNRKYPKKENLFQKIKYVGKVYCPSIPNTTFMIRRNGKVSITGNSMYPSAIRTWNLGPDTTRITNIKDYTGKYNFYRKGKTMVLDIPDENFKKNIEVTVDMSKTGFLKAEIEKLAAERKRLKDLMKEAKTKAETDAYDSRQIAVKVILNSLFGYMGSAYANYSDMATGLTITGMCRWTSKFVSSLLDSHIVNIDTDGFIVDTVQNVEELNSKIAEYIKNNQGVTSYMILEEEPLIDGFFYRMKNYAVRMIKKGKTIIVKHGVAFKSSKQAAVCDTILDTVCQRTLDRTVQDQFIEATELKKLSQYPLSAFKFRVTFSKDLAGYKNGMSLHRAIGLQVEERLKTKVEEGLQVDYYVTKQPAHCKALQDAFKETRRIKGPYYTISQYVTSAEQLDEQYYLDQIDKLFAIFNWKIEPQLHMFE